MGRLPLAFAGKNITFRIPYEMAGEIVLNSAQTGIQFPDTVFAHNVDKPFEVHRIKPLIAVLDENGNVLPNAPSQEVLQSYVRVRMSDLGKNELLTKSPTLLNLLVSGTSRQTWEWEEPYTIVRSEAFQVVADALDLTNLQAFMQQQAEIRLRLSLIFQGFILVVGPPSEMR
jgi:hypothetical protein